MVTVHATLMDGVGKQRYRRIIHLLTFYTPEYHNSNFRGIIIQKDLLLTEILYNVL